MCKEFIEQLEMLGIGYAWVGDELVVDISDVEQLILVDLMEHLEDRMMDYTVSEDELIVMPKSTDSIYVDVIVDETDWEAIGLEIELFARHYIPEQEDAFGKFMYHAELVKNGHLDVSEKDRSQIVEPYYSILSKIIDKGGR
jgi:hypothetical protein